jgi:hypothetical protein
MRGELTDSGVTELENCTWVLVLNLPKTNEIGKYSIVLKPGCLCCIYFAQELTIVTIFIVATKLSFR